ncbi:hypothetical protein MNB_SUP05-SYMBIONT-4-1077 [hydrothermal vent metagenome]|uniref:Uncharacterized protein n=1 Tax=hydrothermal vent metagenome TaxID=652676 RepID=A0A1W1DZW4_9ZZZZ
MSLRTAVFLASPNILLPENRITATAAAIIAKTIDNSTIEKPLCFLFLCIVFEFFIFFLFVVIKYI